MLKGLHHNAYRCRDSEETRKFYSDFLGLPLVQAFQIHETKSGRATKTLHSFYQMDDGSCLAFFEAPDMPFAFKDQHDFDLHIALEVSQEDLHTMFAKGKAAGLNRPVPGCSITITPTKPNSTAAQTGQPLRSPSIGPASAVTNKGTVKYSATASAKGKAGKAM